MRVGLGRSSRSRGHGKRKDLKLQPILHGSDDEVEEMQELHAGLSRVSFQCKGLIGHDVADNPGRVEPGIVLRPLIRGVGSRGTGLDR